MLLLNPKKHVRKYSDEKSRQIMLKTIEFFEKKGLKNLKADWHEKKWNYDFVEFLKENQVFATLMTPSGYGAPIWLGSNEEVKHKTAKLLQDGEVFAFGLSEKEHGADIYSSDMMLYPQEDGNYKANGDKYYIGNGNEAALVSTFAKMADSEE